MIRKAVTYFLIISALIYAVRELHYYGLLKQEKGYYAKYKTAFFEKNDYNVLFLGSSRAEMHYNTLLFDSLTGKNSFNLSLAGATPRVAFAALKAYLVNSRAPEEIFYEVDFHSLNIETTEIKEFNNYFPFFKNKVLLEEFNKIDGRMKHFYFNPFYSFPYTGQKNLSTSLHGWLNIHNETDLLYHKGYFREIRRPSLKYLETKHAPASIHPSERRYLDSIIFLAEKLNIKLQLVTSPMFGGGAVDVSNKKELVRELKSMAVGNNINYIDFSATDFCDRREYFIDHFHMNARGAREFTLKFVDFYNNNRPSRALN